MKNIREIIRLYYHHNLSFRKISAIIGTSRPVISEYIKKFKKSGLKYEDLKQIRDDELSEHLKSTKKEKSEKYRILSGKFDYFTKELTKTGVSLFKLWTEYKEENRDGYSYAQFCYHYQVYSEVHKTTMHMDYKAGERVFVDFAGKKLTIVDREPNKEKQVEVFVALLALSQYTYVEAVENQKKETLVRCTENSLWHFGGVPASIMPDCLKSAVTKYHKYESEINPLYADFSEHYDTVIFPARPAKPKDKALVEGAVKIIYTRIYAELRHRTFYSLQELNQAILKLLEKHNTTNFQQLDMSRKQLFEEQEKDALQPLPLELYQFKTFCRNTVGYNYHIYLAKDKHYYSVPHQYITKKVEVRYTDRVVEIYYKNLRIAVHPRDQRPKQYSTLEQHMPEAHRKQKEMNKWNSERLINWGKSIGENVKGVIEKAIGQRKYDCQAFNTCLGILNLAKKYSSTRLEKACKKALYLNSVSFKTINNLLKNGLENEDEEDLFSTLPDHDNVRGAEYYGNKGEHIEPASYN